MKSQNYHTIEKMFVEVNTTQMETANRLKDNLSSFLRVYVFPQIERLLEKYDFSHRVIRIDSLSLSINVVGSVSYDDLERQIAQQLSEKFSSVVDAIQDEREKSKTAKDNSSISPEKRSEELFFFFLEHGYLPWYGNQDDVNVFIDSGNWQKQLRNSAFVAQLISVLSSSERTVDRFIMQTTNDRVMEFIGTINLGAEKIYHYLPHEARFILLRFLLLINLNRPSTEIFQLVSELALFLDSYSKSITDIPISELKQKLISVINETGPLSTEQKNELTHLIRNKNRNEKIQEIEIEHIVQISTDDATIDEKVKTEQQELPFFDENADSVYVKQAGLILLHPFLKQFFKHIGLLDGAGKIKKESLTQAVQTLSYLADGNESFFEGNMMLSKFLCGMPLKMPIPKDSLLTKEIKGEAETLLKEVVRNWAALKNSSPNGLRQLFLLRDGKLMRRNEHFRLIVERKAQDVLLDKLDWNISIIKLAWIKGLLFVEW